MPGNRQETMINMTYTLSAYKPAYVAKRCAFWALRWMAGTAVAENGKLCYH
jgi:hypothetical protein